MEVAELTGAELDYWVAKAEGIQVAIKDNRCYGPLVGWYAPSSNWLQGGPIMERERLDSEFHYTEWLCRKIANGHFYGFLGSTLLEAAMRCYVATKFGNEMPG